MLQVAASFIRELIVEIRPPGARSRGCLSRRSRIS
jgi:hypothetical protein